MKQKTRAAQNTRQTDTDLEVLQDTPPWDWPKSAGEKFKSVLIDRQALESDRMIAAELAGDFVAINDDLAESLLTVLGAAEESDELRAQSAISLGPALESADLGDFDDPIDVPPISEEVFHKIQRFLRILYTQENIPKLVRRRILEASVRAPELWHQDAVTKAYASGDRDWMLTAVFAMKYVRGFEPQILEALKNQDQEIHCEAVEAAGNWEVDAAWPHVYALVRNARTPKPLLLAAIGAVASIRDNTESLELLNELVDSKDEEISDAADEALSLAGAYTEFDEDAFEDDEDASGWIN